ncbi:YhbY family RNA-binding protein [Massilia frigida]|nr:YhbY family RNA-binding protein [Massilia frigida]
MSRLLMPPEWSVAARIFFRGEMPLDAICREWFKTDTVKVKVELDNADEFLSAEEIAELTGAPKDSDIVVSRVGDVIQFRIRNPIFAEDMFRYLTADADGLSYYLTNVVMVLKDEFTNMGIGPRCVVKEIYCARSLHEELPIRCIKLNGVGDYASFHWAKDPLRGYYVWPCMGFDAEIPDAVRTRLPEKYREKRRLSDLMLDEGGRKEWLRHGESVKLAFDLDPGSVSWEVLSHYVREKGIEL